MDTLKCIECRCFDVCAFALQCVGSVSDGYSMPPTKTATLNLRIDPMIKEAAREAAIRQQRSVANMIEVLIRQHCVEAGMPIPEQQSLFKEKGDG